MADTNTTTNIPIPGAPLPVQVIEAQAENWVKQMISDNTGGASASRFLLLAWGLGVLGIWIFVSIHTGGFVPIPTDVTTILLGLSATKTVQRFGEKQ